MRGQSAARANLADADLAGANLARAYLADADLARANLADADLTFTNLAGADLAGADLAHANLADASLARADLARADLAGANLARANLADANLAGANLVDTCLDPNAPIPPISDSTLIAAGLEPDGKWVRGWRTRRSQHVGSMEYAPRRAAYVAPVFSVAPTACHPGLYIAGFRWLHDNYPREVRLVRARCRRDELHHAGNKFRAKRLWISKA